jgi:iron(III) transport system ATP-binding protein
MAAVALRGIAKRFGATTAVEGLDIAIPDGAFAAFLGPSGCGKTTTLRMVAGLETPTEGEIRIGEEMVFGPRVHVPTERRRIGMVFQSYAVWPHMTVAGNVGFPLRVAGMPRAEATPRIARALETVRLGALAARYPSQLSGGQQQRVALARAIVAEPRLLLLDEPLSNLDAKLREEMRDEIRDLHRRLGVTALYVTHDQMEALALADIVFVMSGGRLQQAGTPREVYEQPANRFVADFVGWSNLLGAEVAGPDVLRIAGQALPAAVPGSLRVGERCTLAVRPEDVGLGPPEGASLAGRVTAVTYLGRHQAVEVALDGALLRAQLPPEQTVREGEAVGVALPAARTRVLPA